MKFRVRAFTIIELLVAMVIGGLVASFAYYGYDIVWRYFQEYRRTDTVIKQLVQLRVAIESDFIHAQTVSTGNNAVVVSMPNGSQVNYSFYNSVVIRNQEASIDSFNVSITYHEPRYKSIKVITAGFLVDELYLEATITGEQERCYFFKNYSAEERMLKEQ